MKRKLFIDKPLTELPSDHRFNGIDIMKFIAAYLICLIHIDPFYLTNLPAEQVELMNMVVQQYLCRVAVPFFFIVSGFLFFRKTENGNIDSNRIKNYCFRNLRLFGMWTLLLFVGGTDHLWYLTAVVFAVFVLSFLFNKGVPIWKISVLVLITYTLGLMFTSYGALTQLIEKKSILNVFFSGIKMLFPSTRNGLFFGLIFVFIGAIFAQKRIVINIYLAIFGFILSIVAFFIEFYFLYSFAELKAGEMYISLLPVSFFLFYIVSHINIKDRPVYSEIRALGILIFFMHKFVGYFAEIIFAGFNKIVSWNVYAVYSIAILIATTILAIMIFKLSKKPRFDWFKYLYS